MMKRFYCDEDCTPYDVYDSVQVNEFSDGAYRVHYDCLTEEEKKLWRKIMVRENPHKLEIKERMKELIREGKPRDYVIDTIKDEFKV